MKGTPGRPTGIPAVPLTSEGTSASGRRASIHGSQRWSQSPSRTSSFSASSSFKPMNGAGARSAMPGVCMLSGSEP